MHKNNLVYSNLFLKYAYEMFYFSSEILCSVSGFQMKA